MQWWVVQARRRGGGGCRGGGGDAAGRSAGRRRVELGPEAEVPRRGDRTTAGRQAQAPRGDGQSQQTDACRMGAGGRRHRRWRLGAQRLRQQSSGAPASQGGWGGSKGASLEESLWVATRQWVNQNRQWSGYNTQASSKSLRAGLQAECSGESGAIRVGLVPRNAGYNSAERTTQPRALAEKWLA